MTEYCIVYNTQTDGYYNSTQWVLINAKSCETISTTQGVCTLNTVQSSVSSSSSPRSGDHRLMKEAAKQCAAPANQLVDTHQMVLTATIDNLWRGTMKKGCSRTDGDTEVEDG